MKFNKLIVVTGLALSLSQLSINNNSTEVVGQTIVTEINSYPAEFEQSSERAVAYDMSATGRAKRFVRAVYNALIAGPTPDIIGSEKILSLNSMEDESLSKYDN